MPRNLSRRSVAYPLSHQQQQQQALSENDGRLVEVEKLRGEVTELRGRLYERDREVEALRARLDARDVELQTLADGMNKQMKKLKRDLKKLKSDTKKGAATKSADADGKEKKTARKADAGAH
jgi:chromosome segregation ATPase